MFNLEFLETQLQQFYSRIEEDIKRITTIRNWCITVWIAIPTLTSSIDSRLPTGQRTLLSVMPVLLFWLIEGLQRYYLEQHGNRARKLEKAILYGTVEAEDIELYLFLTGEKLVSQREKREVLVKCLFYTKAVLIFYGTLLIGAIVIQQLLK